MNLSKSFNPIDYHFSWTSDWYSWDDKAAMKAALQARNAEAKRLRAEGWTVHVSASTGNLMSRGGIGSNHPHVEFFVPVYRIHASKS